MECIVLAGGLGTRLHDVVNDVPKCLAPVAGLPFLAHIFKKLETQFVDHVILSLGYKHELVIDFLRTKAFTFKVSWVIEKEPLGTGGGLRLAMGKSRAQEVVVLNGDTYFDLDLRKMEQLLQATDKAVVALKPMTHFDRYGSVTLDGQNMISGFHEKKFMEEGLINGGVYLLNKRLVRLSDFSEKFSFEKDFLENEAGKNSLRGMVSDRYFIDIGVPEDFYKAQKDFS